MGYPYPLSMPRRGAQSFVMDRDGLVRLPPLRQDLRSPYGPVRAPTVDDINPRVPLKGSIWVRLRGSYKGSYR